MATVVNAVQFLNQTSNFNSINNSINVVINSLETLNLVASKEIETEKISEAQKKYDDFNKTVKAGIEKVKGMANALKPLLILSDKYADQNAALDSIKGQRSTGEEREQIASISKKSRTPFAQTLDTVSRLNSTAGGSFKTSDEAEYFTELANKALVGTDKSGKASGLDAIVKAMQTGSLKGNDLTSVMDKAPALADAVKTYTGKPVDYEKGVSADVLKNSVYNSAATINDEFAKAPVKFEDLGQMLSDSVMNAFAPVFQILIEAATWINNNWSTLEPIFWGLAAAAAAFAIGLGVVKVVLFLASIAQAGFNVALMVCPLILVAVLIGVIIGCIVKWIQSVGGMHVAWLIVVDAILFAWDTLKIGFFIGIYGIIDLFNKMMLSLKTVSVGIQNFMGDMKVGVLTILQDMVNGAIDIINQFIGLLNKIQGVSINTISKVQFGANAKLQNEAEKKAREKELEDYRASVEAGIAENESKIKKMKDDRDKSHDLRKLEITKEQQANLDKNKNSGKYAAESYKDLLGGAAAGNTGGSAGGLANYANNQQLQNNIANTAYNTGAMRDNTDETKEDLKYMRDVAEQEVINRFTTAELKVDMTNHNNINSNLDLDGVVSYMEQKVYETMSAAAEGVYV